MNHHPVSRTLTKRDANILQRYNERHWLAGAFGKAEGNIESARILRDGVNDHSTNANGIGCMGDSHRRIAKQRTADAPTLPGFVNCEPRATASSSDSPGSAI